MVILGLDLSLTSPGWFLFDARGQISYGVLRPPAEMRGVERMDFIWRYVLGKIPTLESVTVIIEGFSFGSKGSAVYEIGGLGYIVRYALWHRKIPVIEVQPSQLKKYVCGVGNAKKNIMVREVFKRWNIDAADDNVADAIGLGRIGMNLAGIDEPQTAFQRAVIADLRKKFRLGVAA